MIDFKTWGPLTVLAVASILLVLLGGLAEVVLTDDYSFRAFLDDLKYVAAALAAATPIARAIRLNRTDR